MKKFILLFAFASSFSLRSSACADYSFDDGYYNLFMQETIGDPQYFPFLLTLESSYYDSDSGSGDKLKN